MTWPSWFKVWLTRKPQPEPAAQMKLEIPLPIYLNSKSVIDLTAIINGGFAGYEEIKTKDANSDSSSNKTSIGLSPEGFAIMKFGASDASSSEIRRENERSRRIVQTNASLFAQLRSDLYRKQIVAESPETAKPGEFIELRATYSRPPLESILETMTTMINVGDRLSNPGSHKSRDKQLIPPVIIEVKKMLQQSSTIDLVGLPVSEGHKKVILYLDREIVGDSEVGDILVGEYSFFGKVISRIEEGDEWNSLLKTELGAFKGDAIRELEKAMLTAAQEIRTSANISHDFELALKGPVLLIHPIAIFS